MLESIGRRRIFRQNQQAARGLLDAAEKGRHESGTLRNEDGDRLYNIVQSGALLNLDLSLVLEDLTGTKDSARRDLYARVLAVLAVGWIDQMLTLLGKPIRLLLASVGAPQAVRAGVARVHKQLHELDRRHGRLLRRVRNTTLAHREHDATQQLELGRSIDHTAMIAFGADLMRWSTGLQRVMHDVLLHYNTDLPPNKRLQPTAASGTVRPPRLNRKR